MVDHIFIMLAVPGSILNITNLGFLGEKVMWNMKTCNLEELFVLCIDNSWTNELIPYQTASHMRTRS